MLAVKFVCVGRMREKFYIDAFGEYTKRLQSLCKFEIVEPQEQRLSDNPSDKEIKAALDREAQDIMKDPNDQLEKGVSISRSGNVPSAGASFCPQAFGALPSQQVDMDTSPETH